MARVHARIFGVDAGSAPLHQSIQKKAARSKKMGARGRDSESTETAVALTHAGG